MDVDEANKLEVLIELARKRTPGADAVNGAEIVAAGAMTGWRLSGILREFPSFPDRYAFFRYPVHVMGADTDTLLQDCRAVGELPQRKPLTPAERAELGRETARRRRDDAINETRMAFDALNDGTTPVTTKRMAEYLDITERAARSRLQSAGFTPMEGAKGVWTEKE